MRPARDPETARQPGPHDAGQRHIWRRHRGVPLTRLWLAVLCGYLALGATLQELPRYVPGRFHVGAFAVGITVGLAFAGTAAARPFAGRAGDAGHSRPVAMTGALLTATGPLAFSWPRG